MEKTDERRIDFYFDYISHNAYLAWHLLPDLAKKYGYELRAIPVLFAAFLKEYGQLGPAEIAPKIDWMNRNNLRKARLLGIPFNAPKLHPFNPLLLLRLSAQEMPEVQRAALTSCLLRGVWVDSLDPTDSDAVRRYLDSNGIDAEPLIAGASSTHAKEQLRKNCDAAIARGGFGVPTMIVGNEVFWGYDDLPYLETLLADKDPFAQADVTGYLKAWEVARAAGQHR
ncbi:MAG: 2-hydroxychromene-2-carboxylate isomerase [Proteobacteria bacterium]|nr:2-hydroxychromene-2-carboxylate isomerase [Pseudomonadota bacterium]